MWRNAARFAAGFVLATIAWWYLTPAYDGLLCRAAEPLLRMDGRFANATVTGSGRSVGVEGAGLPAAVVPADQLTYNIILLTALYAMGGRLLGLRTSAGFAGSLAILAASHVAAICVSIEATYATRMPGFGDAHYGGMAQDFWAAAEYVYQLGGMFAIAFACWWTLIRAPESRPAAVRKPRAEGERRPRSRRR